MMVDMVAEPAIELRAASARPSAARRDELAAFLRTRRARLSPADVGLPPGLRRRTAGLRREEVAQLAGVGVTWYTWLEQGRPINASVQVLSAISRTLQLDNAEHDHLLRLAGMHIFPTQEERATVPAEVLEVLNSLSPLPAILVNARYDILAQNEPYQALLRDWHTQPCERRNVLWCCFTEPEVRRHYLNFDAEAPRIVATFRSAYAQHVGEPVWQRFIACLSARSPDFSRLWERHDVAQPGQQQKVFWHDVAGELRMMSTSLAVSGLPEHRIIVCTPADDDTRARLALIHQ
ncbi:MAG TPA: helix-turn-helix transcriptional regulator [Acidothermaceae bacterium]|jgi:transcriptional regulator with XRE-family HTH domain